MAFSSVPPFFFLVLNKRDVSHVGAVPRYCLTYPYLNLSHFQPQQQQARFNFDAADAGRISFFMYLKSQWVQLLRIPHVVVLICIPCQKTHRIHGGLGLVYFTYMKTIHVSTTCTNQKYTVRRMDPTIDGRKQLGPDGNSRLSTFHFDQ